MTLTGPARLALALAALAGAASIAVARQASPTEPPPTQPVTAKVIHFTESRRARVTSVALSNGVLLHHRQMDSPQVQVAFTLAGSEMLEAVESRGLSQLLAQAMDAAAANPTSAPDQTQQADTDRASADAVTPARVQVSAGPDCLRVRVWGTIEQVQAAAPRVAAVLAPAALTDEVIQDARAELLAQIQRRARSPRLAIVDALNALLFTTDPGDARVTPLTVEQAAQLSSPAVRDWLSRHVQGGPRGSAIEAAVVGDIGLERAVALTRVMLGQLPARPVPRSADEQRQSMGAAPWPARPVGPVKGKAKLASQPAGRSIVLVGCFAADAHEITRVRTLRAACGVLDDSARAGLVAGGIQVGERDVGAGVTLSPQPGFGLLMLTAEVPSEQAGAAAGILWQTLTSVSGDLELMEQSLGVRTTELVAGVESVGKDAGYWSGVLSRASALRLDLDQVGQGAAFYQSLSSEQVLRALREVVDDGNRVELIVSGDGAAATGP